MRKATSPCRTTRRGCIAGSSRRTVRSRCGSTKRSKKSRQRPTDFVHGLRAQILTDQKEVGWKEEMSFPLLPSFGLIRENPCPKAVYEVRGPSLLRRAHG